MVTAQKQLTDKVISEDNPSLKNDSALLIRNASEIYSLLNKVTKHHALINVSISGKKDIYSSALLEFNKDEAYLVLDELYPEDGNKFLDIGKNLSLQTQYQGAMLQFKTMIEAINKDDDGAYYKIPIPKSVDFRQRRSTHRVFVGIDETVPISLVTEENVMISAELRDISLGGLSIRIDEPAHVSLVEGVDIPICLISASELIKIKTSIILLHVEKAREKGALRIGAAFTSMSNMDRRLLEKFIAELERKMIKRIRRVV